MGKKTTRILSALICMLVMACAVNAAQAEAVTLNIALSGEVSTEGGAVTVVRLDGRFRIWQNGAEVGIIGPGESITLLSQGAAAWKRVRDLLTQEPEVADDDLTDPAITELGSAVRFTGLRFRYGENL